MRKRSLMALAVVALVAISACGKETPKPKITVGSANFSESITLAEVYYQGLKAKGFDVDKKLNIGAREAYFPALLSGSLDLLPEYTGSTLNYITKDLNASKPDPQANYAALVSALKAKNITVLEMSSAQDQDGIVVNKETATKYSLNKVSDLKSHGSELVMGGPPECPKRQPCLKGLQDVYGIKFKEFKALDVGGANTVRLLAANQIQVANLFTTDARIAVNGFVLLADDKGIVGAENVVPVVRKQIVDAYGSDFTTAVNAITAKITTAGLTELNKSVDVDKEDASKAAHDWLQKNNLL